MSGTSGTGVTVLFSTEAKPCRGNIRKRDCQPVATFKLAKLGDCGNQFLGVNTVLTSKLRKFVQYVHQYIPIFGKI